MKETRTILKLLMQLIFDIKVSYETIKTMKVMLIKTKNKQNVCFEIKPSNRRGEQFIINGKGSFFDEYFALLQLSHSVSSKPDSLRLCSESQELP